MSETVPGAGEAKAPVNETVAYERRDVNTRAVFRVGVASVVAAVVIHAAVWWLFDLFDRREAQKGPPPATLVNTPRAAPPEPRLQTDAPADLNDFRAEEKGELESYGWMDRQKGVVRIPVERAMALLLERGLPGAEPPGRKNGGTQPGPTSQGQNR